ncbi:putative phospholipid-transporting ATPase DRS2 [Smittium mucronatum]|uniref:Phospholipid-transporting ATPase n=1 Tax=Smittium mucronatum TaxID=133383 RepID=A0A1R0GZG2_9FUNG|nr:putative phospholipid-transporting ATPase DRS2 [Smittium mucronatum]
MSPRKSKFLKVRLVDDDQYELESRDDQRGNAYSGITIGQLVPEDIYDDDEQDHHLNSNYDINDGNSDYGLNHMTDPGNPSDKVSSYQKKRYIEPQDAGYLTRASTIIKKGFDGLVDSQNSSENTGESRMIHLNSQSSNKSLKYISNYVTTAKYNFFTFIPKFLLEQFSKYANVFFLFTSCIQQIPGVTPTSRYTTLFPLLVVLFATAIKEVVEDYKRHSSDKEVNTSIAKVIRDGILIECQWRYIEVGDIIRLDNKDSIPADMVLLSSSEPEGLCYIETSNLDGETNLKIKQARPETSHLITLESVSKLVGFVRSELPNDNLYNYEGVIISKGGILGNCTFPLDPQQLLLRGAVLRNTDWIFGVVVSTGHETKLMRSATSAPIKQTTVERMTNKQILFLFVILLVLAVFSASGNYIFLKNNRQNLNYLMISSYVSAAQFVKNILTFIILYNNLIPISLMVTMEIVKYWQAQLINSDLDMFDEKTGTPASARSSSLVEELGQVGFIFSDKTGTLTCNIMEFKMCSIAGNIYAETVDPAKRAKVIKGKTVGHYDFDALLSKIKSSGPQGELYQFFEHMATCHTVIPERTDPSTNSFEYQASSPDEGALVKGAAMLDFIFTTRKPRSITVNILGEMRNYEVLCINEFNSSRKRMSAILRCPDGKIRLFCKGADTVILERLEDNSSEYVQKVTGHLEEFATEGLRTLCLSMREISEGEYDQWKDIYLKAAQTVNNRQQQLDSAAELIERNMVLLGATAIEDKLQDGVPKTIFTLAQAGIKIWVLTGDRQETAINIGYSCKLIQEDFSLIICNSNTHWETKEFLRQKLLAIRDSSNGAGAVDLNSLALIIDGRSLDFALEKDIEDIFLELAVLCKSVICCRVSPLQKALVVKLVKRKRNEVLLAIGDGANDVSMIQAAHVGVGISGQEGLQAARSSDFAISEFRHLRKLLLVHGSWSYHRLSKMILYSFYKNITLYITQFLFAFYNGFSGQTLYESWTITGYSVFFTVMPPISIGLFDQYLYARSLDRYPEMYKMGQNSEFFNVSAFWGSTINAFIHSVIIFFLGTNVLKPFVTYHGLEMNHWAYGVTLYSAVVLTVLLKAALLTSTWTKWTVVAIPGSLLIWIGFIPLYGYVGPKIKIASEYQGMNSVTLGNLTYWLVFLLIPITCILRDYSWKYFKRMYLSRAYQIVQEIQKFNIPDYRPRMERFRKAVHKARALQRMRKNRGYAFSQTETDQTKLIRSYDTTRTKPSGN